MSHAWMVFAAAAALVSASGSKPRNTLKLPSFRGVAEVRSGIPGRLRLYMPAIAENPEAARAMKAQLESAGAIIEVQLNERTGTALFLYDPEQVEAAVVEGAAIRLMGLDAEINRQPVSRMESGLRTLWDAVNHGVMEATGGLMDARMLTGSALTVAALRGLITGGAKGPGALTLLWWAANVFRRRGND
ncbi:MAG: hypothetical protein IKQ80_10180 [Clostridia bacterium]|nr:hypothetical protein [Clostridia bacterium]